MIELAQIQQPVCNTRPAIVEMIEKRYGENRVAAALQSPHGVVEIFVNDKTRKWTMIITRPNGTSCIVSVGEAWIPFNPLTGDPA